MSQEIKGSLTRKKKQIGSTYHVNNYHLKSNTVYAFNLIFKHKY